MKCHALTLWMLSPAILAQAPNPAPADAPLQALLDDWHEAAAKADEARYFGHLSEDAIFIGTDATERWTKAQFLTYCHPHFAKGRAWTFKATRRVITLAPKGGLAWFDEDLATTNMGPCRGSGVLRKDPDGRWRIVHYVLSLSVPNEKMGAVLIAVGTKK